MSITKNLIVPPGAAPVRLDLFLAQQTGLSRSHIQKLIKSGQIYLNGKTAKAHHVVRPGDAITVPADAPMAAPPKDTGLEPAILFEDENYLVVNKPAGLVVHGGPGIAERTLADWAAHHAPEISEVGDQPKMRPGIVHRLDRDVSGIMVIAKTQAAFVDLKKQFQNHSIIKEYVALVHGRLTDAKGRINFAIARKPDKSGLMVARIKSTEGKVAETLFTVERHLKNMTLVRVQTLTGRTHQIRVHFKAIGHPLVGDPLYKKRKLQKEKIAAPRLFLHAEVLGFTDLNGQIRRYTASLPEELQRWLGKM